MKNEIFEEMTKAKCSIPDCQEKGFIFVTTPVGTIPFCHEHFEIYLRKSPEWDKTAKKAIEIMKQSKGEMVRIDSFEEMKRRVKPEFLAIATQGLELTKGKCLECGKKAVGIISFMKPVCEEHIGFPRMVDKVVLK